MSYNKLKGKKITRKKYWSIYLEGYRAGKIAPKRKKR